VVNKDKGSFGCLCRFWLLDFVWGVKKVATCAAFDIWERSTD
jgi:hypothetical protein